MTVNQIRVEITTIGSYTATADDANVAGQGASAYADLENFRDVVIPTGAGKEIIPFHAIDHSVVTITPTTVADPTDPTCP